LKSNRLIFFLFFVSGINLLKAQNNTDSLNTPAATNDPKTTQDNTFTPWYRKGVMYSITTTTGLHYNGFVVAETPAILTIENRSTHQTYDLAKTEIVEARQLNVRESQKEVLGENEHADSYMFASSAFPFKSETVQSTLHWFLLENVQYNVNENWAVCLSTVAFYPMSLGLKCSFAIDDHNFIGGHVFGIGNPADNQNFFVGFGGIAKFTSGTSNRNFTISGGMLGINSDILYSTPQPFPIYNLFFSNLAYCTRLNEHVALNLEGWYFPQAQFGLAGAGIKLVKNEDSCWTFGCYGVMNMLTNTLSFKYKALPIPYLGMTQRF